MNQLIGTQYVSHVPLMAKYDSIFIYDIIMGKRCSIQYESYNVYIHNESYVTIMY